VTVNDGEVERPSSRRVELSNASYSILYDECMWYNGFVKGDILTKSGRCLTWAMPQQRPMSCVR